MQSPGREWSRRGFLGAAAGAAGVLATAGWADSAAALAERAVAVAPAGSDLGAIEHVVVIMQENRSFDHYFGSYRGVRGFDDHSGAFAQPWPGGKASKHASKLLPYRLDHATVQAQCAGSSDTPIHDWGPQHESWAKGRMDGFVTTHSKKVNDGPEQGPLVMGYFTREDLPLQYALADNFTICDAYHASVIGPTMPNRLYSLSGTIDPAGKHGGPVVSTPDEEEASAAVGSCSWPTMFEALQDHGVSWKVYQPENTSVGALEHVNLAVGFNALLYFQQYLADPSSELYRRAFLPVWPDEFASRRARQHVAVGVVADPHAHRVGASVGRAAERRRATCSRRSRRCSAIRRCGRRPSCSSPTTRTADSSTTLRRPPRPRAPRARSSPCRRCPSTPPASPGRSGSGSGCPRSWCRRSVAVGTSTPISSTTPRCFGSSRRASTSRLPTSRRGDARRSATSRRRWRSARPTPPSENCPRRPTSRLRSTPRAPTTRTPRRCSLLRPRCRSRPSRRCRSRNPDAPAGAT